MDRRRFLKFLSQASIGAGIVYSFPSIIVSKNIMTPEEFFTSYSGYDNSISFAAMQRAYNKASMGNATPDFIFVSDENYNRMLTLIEPQLRFSDLHEPIFGNPNFKFMGANVVPQTNLDNQSIHTIGKLFGNLGRYKIGVDV